MSALFRLAQQGREIEVFVIAEGEKFLVSLLDRLGVARAFRLGELSYPVKFVHVASSRFQPFPVVIRGSPAHLLLLFGLASSRQHFQEGPAVAKDASLG